ncbi:hypothetical protein [Mesorhizobium sp. NPDC059025]|uniref:hypothetical protein n=1 Tax=unclassified Mesorhizobium TaxID=325217 RepID=UPI0036ABC3E9
MPRFAITGIDIGKTVSEGAFPARSIVILAVVIAGEKQTRPVSMIAKRAHVRSLQWLPRPDPLTSNLLRQAFRKNFDTGLFSGS